MRLNINEIKSVKHYDIKKHEHLNKPPVHFICGDNIELLRYCYENMLKGYFHVGIVDPPYGISVGDMKLGATKESKPRDGGGGGGGGFKKPRDNGGYNNRY